MEAPQTQPYDQEVLGRCPAESGLFQAEKEHLLPRLVIFLEMASRGKYGHVGNQTQPSVHE